MTNNTNTRNTFLHVCNWKREKVTFRPQNNIVDKKKGRYTIVGFGRQKVLRYTIIGFGRQKVLRYTIVDFGR